MLESSVNQKNLSNQLKEDQTFDTISMVKLDELSLPTSCKENSSCNILDNNFDLFLLDLLEMDTLSK